MFQIVCVTCHQIWYKTDKQCRRCGKSDKWLREIPDPPSWDDGSGGGFGPRCTTKEGDYQLGG